MVDPQLQNYILKDVEGLDRLKERGRGCYGSVYELKVNGVPCIGKKLHNILIGRVREVDVSEEQKTTIINTFIRECEILSRLRHPNIVQFMGVHLGVTNMDITLIMESVHMDLDKCVKNYSDSLTLPYKLNILRDIAYGLSYLHSCSVIHRDLNQGNVLLTEALTAKIADLGASKVIDYSNEIAGMSTFPGALGYMPPEAMQSPAIYDTKLDCFSFGQLSLYLLNCQFPNLIDSNITAKDVQEKSIQIAKRRSSLATLGTSHVLYNTIIQCLFDEPDRRPSSRELASTMTNISSLCPVQYKNILDYIGIINKLKTINNNIDETNGSLENSVPHGDDLYLPVRETANESVNSISPMPTPLLLTSSDRKLQNTLQPVSPGTINLPQGSLPISSLHSPSPGPPIPQLRNPSPGPPIPPLRNPSPGPPIPPLRNPSPSTPISSLRNPSPGPPIGSISPRPMSPSTQGPSGVKLNSFFSDTQSRNFQVSPIPPDSRQQSAEPYDYIDTATKRTIEEQAQERTTFTPSSVGNMKVSSDNMLLLKKQPNTRQRSLTELIEEYDSDDDSYVRVDEFTAQSSINSQKQNNRISSHDHCLPTASLPATITPYASPSNFSSSGTYIYGKMPREIAEALCCNHGDYLVRASPTTGGLVLSVKLDDIEFGHLSIHKTVNRKLRNSKTAYFFNAGNLFDSLTDLIIDLALAPFLAESKQMITLKKPVTVEDRKILEPNEIIAGSLLDKKRQYTLSSSIVALNNEETTAKILTTNQCQVIWEGYVLSQLEHSNVVRMVGLCIEKPVCLLLEKCARNCVTDYLLIHSGRTLDYTFLLKISTDIASGMSYLHSKSIIHRSLAARNCVLSSDFTTAKICNLQRSSLVSNITTNVSDYTNFAIGWASPEILNKGAYSKSSDVWSFGVLMWEIFNSGREPYGGITKPQLLDKIHSKNLIQLPINAPVTCINVFDKCFMYQPQDRPTFAEVVYMLLQKTKTVNPEESIYF